MMVIPNTSERAFIQEAKKFLETESILLKIANTIGKPLEYLHRSLPKSLESQISTFVEKALYKSLELALKSSSKTEPVDDFMKSLELTTNSRVLHGGLTAITGGIGGFFGKIGLAIELPITTTLIMRNIIEVGKSFYGIQQMEEFPLQCLQVFILGSEKSNEDDALDSSYYTTRAALSSLMKQGSEFLAANSSRVVLENLQKGTAPSLINFISKISAQFEMAITEKLLAELIPVVGAIGGATINIAFTDYYGEAAKYHFGLLYLERKYGKEMIERFYHTNLQIRSFS